MLEMALFLLCVSSADTAGAEAVHTPYWRLDIKSGAIHSLRYDPEGAGRYGTELTWRPLSFIHDGRAVPIVPEQVSVSEDGRVLHLNPGEARTQLRWFVDCSPEGYYDRLTQRSLQTSKAESPALLAFMSGGKGHYTLIESFKRVKPERINSGELFLSRSFNPGQTTRIETVDGTVLRVGHRAHEGARFSFEGDRLLAVFTADENGIALQACDLEESIRLDGGEWLPRFSFGEDSVITNSLGGSQTLNRLFNTFYLQAAFWYPGGHGIGAWAAWGGQGHAYINSPYRVDSRDALTSQIIADDGHGRDGYAWTWGDRLGWPFPEGYDTRHFGINAMHIVGAQAQLGWSGERDLVSGIDFSLFGYAGGERKIAQDIAPASYRLLRGQVFSQPFRIDEAIERLALNFGVRAVDVYGEDLELLDRRIYPARLETSTEHLPMRVAHVPGATVAQRFTAAEPFNTVGVFTCAWHTPHNKMRLRAFLWAGDYQATLAEAPLGETVVPDVRDNGFSCLLLDEAHPAGTEVLVVLDRPEPPTEGGEVTAGVWHYPVPEDHPPLLLHGEAMAGRSLRIVSGTRLFPSATIRVEDGDGNTLYEERHEIVFPDGRTHGEFGIDVALPPGGYVVHVISEGSAIFWNGSKTPTSLGGSALYEGQSWNWLERCRRAMAYQLEVLHGERERLLLLDGNQGDKDHSGVSGVTVGNNYYDILPFGYLDAYANAWFYDSLRAMAALERAYGDPKQAERYETLREEVLARYNEVFWTDSGHVDGASRYIGCVDGTGARHDYGFSFVNTLAATVGLADAGRAERILDWLDNGHAYNPDGGREDIYHFQFGPRTTTIDNPDWWAVNQRYESYPWGDQIQNGGADLYESYYDLQTRLFARGADDAYDRFMALMQRYAEPDRLTGGSPLYTGDSIQGGDTAGAAGVMSYEFPETAMLAAIVVYGFLGASADDAGLHIRPRLPAAQPYIRAENVYYHGTYFDVEAHHDHVRVDVRPEEERFHFRIGETIHIPPFTYDGPYESDGGICIHPVAVR